MGAPCLHIPQVAEQGTKWRVTRVRRRHDLPFGIADCSGNTSGDKPLIRIASSEGGLYQDLAFGRQDFAFGRQDLAFGRQDLAFGRGGFVRA
jgi:hypothetical protein